MDKRVGQCLDAEIGKDLFASMRRCLTYILRQSSLISTMGVLATSNDSMLSACMLLILGGSERVKRGKQDSTEYTKAAVPDH